MNRLFEWLANMFGSWKFWIVIAPWNVGVRIRLGKVAKQMGPGLHFRIPFIDEITLINTRVRIDTTGTVTVAGSKPNTSRVVTANIGYAITDPAKAMLQYSYPGTVLQGFVQAEIVAGTDPEEARRRINESVMQHGIRVDFIYYSENVEVRTYRIMQGNGAGFWGGPSAIGDEPVKHY